MHIELASQLGDRRLQGQPRGTRHFAKICEAVSGVDQGETIYLDFSGAEVLTGSWISAALIQLLRWGADPGIELFFVLCNIPDTDLVDELRYVANHARVVFLVAPGNAPARSATVVGPLDPGQKETLLAVVKAGQVTGAGLERLYPGGAVKATAWNNRLKNLHNKRLLMRSKVGREQVYRPVVPEISCDG
jgi:hypothetical protein